MGTLSPSLKNLIDKYSNKKLNGLIVELRYNLELVNEIKCITKFLDDNSTISMRVYCLLNKITDKPICSCGKQLKFHKISRGFYGTCGNEQCVHILRSVKSIESNKKIDKKKSVEKAKQTNLERYGFESNFSGGSPTREKYKIIMKDLYGVEHALQNKGMVKKAQDKMKDKFGTINMFEIPKTINTMIDKYGVKHAMQNKDICNKSSNISKKSKENKVLFRIKEMNYEFLYMNKDFYVLKCNKCNNILPNVYRQMINYCYNNNTIICNNCDYKNHFRSNQEHEIIEEIRKFYEGNIELNRQYLGKEADIILTDKKIAIEHNGVYYHSELFKEKNYHKDKKILFNKKGYDLIQIWEDDWRNIKKQKIIINRLRVKLGYGNKIYARKCIIKEISGKESRNFLQENHLQSYCKSSINIGLFYNNELIYLCTFIKSRISINKNLESYELLRNCAKEDNVVIGGFSKIIKYFEEKYKFNLYSYADCDWVSLKNNAYIKTGFNFIKYTDVEYYWCVNGLRQNRLNFTKQKLIKKGYDKSLTETEIMHTLKNYKIFNSGKLLYFKKAI